MRFKKYEEKIKELIGEEHFAFYRFLYSGNLAFFQRNYKALFYASLVLIRKNISTFQNYTFDQKLLPPGHERYEALSSTPIAGGQSFIDTIGLTEADYTEYERITGIGEDQFVQN